MSIVIRLSDKQLEYLEQYRKIEIDQAMILAEEFPHLEREVKSLKEKDIQSLLSDAIHTAIYYSQKNLEAMNK